MPLRPINKNLFFSLLIIAVVPLVAGIKMISMPGQTYSGPLPPLTSQEVVLRDNLKRHISMLADEIGERNLWRFSELQKAANYIDGLFRSSNFKVLEQTYEVRGRSVKNLEVIIPGTSSSHEILVVGAHYDTVFGSPGANDNGSGVAALVEIARLLANQSFQRTLRLVAFVNEEPPFYRTHNMGSRVYAKRAKRRGDNIIGMLSLETIGYYDDKAGSQHYPVPFGLFYPSTGNFVRFVGSLSSYGLVRAVISSFRRHTKFPSEGTAAPGWLTGIGWSDHESFWKYGYPALMVTDTALFRYAHYHLPTDRPEFIDYDRLARVVAGLARVIVDLANNE